jgi:osmotically-inducible protein OsmY
VIRGGRNPLRHAPILIGAILFAALVGLVAAFVPGSDTEATTPEAGAERVEAALQDALGPAAQGIEVTVESGRVRLSGLVESPQERDAAVRAVRALDPAAAIEDELHVAGVSDASD